VLKVDRPEFDSLAKSDQKTLKVGTHSMGVGSGAWRGRGLPWIFMDATDKVEGGLMVLFFGLVFPVAPLPKFFLPKTLIHSFPA